MHLRWHLRWMPERFMSAYARFISNNPKQKRSCVEDCKTLLSALWMNSSIVDRGSSPRSIHFHFNSWIMKQKKRNAQESCTSATTTTTVSVIQWFVSIEEEKAHIYMLLLFPLIAMKIKQDTTNTHTITVPAKSFHFASFLIIYNNELQLNMIQHRQSCECVWMQKFIKMIAVFGTLEIIHTQTSTKRICKHK